MKETIQVRLHILMAASMKMAVLWDVAPCNLGELDSASSYGEKTRHVQKIPS
jgi:hypothetical protein